MIWFELVIFWLPYLKVGDDSLQVVVPLEGAKVHLVPPLLQGPCLAWDVVLGGATTLQGRRGILLLLLLLLLLPVLFLTGLVLFVCVFLLFLWWFL